MEKEKGINTGHDAITINLLNSINKYLEEKYGSIRPEWKTIIELLGDNLDLYHECKNELKATGIYDRETKRKNPLLSTIKDLHTTCIKLCTQMGLSPLAASKIKSDAEDDSDDFLETLTNE